MLPPSETRETVRILHWNVHGWRDPAGRPNGHDVARLIQEIRPDAVSLVEVDEPWGLPTVLGSVAGESGYSWVFGASFEYGDDESGGGFGNALLARVPVTAVQQWRLFAPSGGYNGSEPSEPRSAVLARLALNGRSFWLGSTHFPRADAAARRLAARRLQRLTAGLSAPWLICGDFNAAPEDCFDGDACLQVSPRPVKPTYPASQPAEAIDYCLSAPGSLVSATVLQAPGSDHLPLLVTVSRSSQDIAA
jgi:endonuclease/exonuclease/phosphatase family metal-dependent hydrolase